MFVRQKEAKYSQISIYQFFGRQHENRHAIACSKILRKEAVFCKSYENTLIRVFLHVEFISDLKTEPKPMVLRNMQKIEKQYMLSLFSIFCDFLNLFQAKFPKTKRIMFVRQKEAKYTQISIYQFFGRQHENRHAIPCSKIVRKEAVFCKSYKNTLIRVFLHAEFISALKTEPKPTVFEKYAENRKKIFVIIIFYFL